MEKNQSPTFLISSLPLKNLFRTFKEPLDMNAPCTKAHYFCFPAWQFQHSPVFRPWGSTHRRSFLPGLLRSGQLFWILSSTTRAFSDHPGQKHFSILIQYSSVKSLSCVRLIATPWTAALQASLSITQLARGCSNSCPSSQWCHPTISSSVIPFSSWLQPCPASESFPIS